MYRDWILIQDAAWGCYPEPGLFTELGFHSADDDDKVFPNDNHYGNVFDNAYVLGDVFDSDDDDNLFAISFPKKVKF